MIKMNVHSFDRRGKLQGLQVMRGVAALLVVWDHLKFNLGVSSEIVAKIPLLAANIGAIGVDIFFVISGFVIAMTAERLRRDWKNFMINRVARIVPLYFTISTFALLISVGRHFLQHHDLPGFNNIFNSYLFLPLFDTIQFSNPLCGNGWTLSFEMWFYLGFGCCLAIFSGKQSGFAFPALMFSGIILTAFFYTYPNWFLPKFLFHPLAIEFCAGCLLYEFRDKIGKVGLAVMIISIPIFLFFAIQHEELGLHIEVISSTQLGFERALIWGGFSICLIGIVTQCDLHHPLQWPRVLLVLGDASYSTYLVTPLIMFPTAAFIHGMKWLHIINSSAITALLSGAFYLIGTVFGGVALWKF
jgi:exopolysaccharide production protein ExoZ